MIVRLRFYHDPTQPRRTDGKFPTRVGGQLPLIITLKNVGVDFYKKLDEISIKVFRNDDDFKFTPIEEKEHVTRRPRRERKLLSYKRL